MALVTYNIRPDNAKLGSFGSIADVRKNIVRTDARSVEGEIIAEKEAAALPPCRPAALPRGLRLALPLAAPLPCVLQPCCRARCGLDLMLACRAVLTSAAGQRRGWTGICLRVYSAATLQASFDCLHDAPIGDGCCLPHHAHHAGPALPPPCFPDCRRACSRGERSALCI